MFYLQGQEDAPGAFCSQLKPIKQTIAATDVGVPADSPRAEQLFDRIIGQFSTLVHVAPAEIRADVQKTASFYRAYRRSVESDTLDEFVRGKGWDKGGEAQARVAAYGEAVCGVEIDPDVSVGH